MAGLCGKKSHKINECTPASIAGALFALAATSTSTATYAFVKLLAHSKSPIRNKI